MSSRVNRIQHASDGVTKILVELADGECVEAVVIPGRRRTTLCLSSQVGCGVGCTFCATATLGFRRQMTPEEIVSQYELAKDLVASGVATSEYPIENLVFMGMGEPFLNYDNLCTALTELLRTHRFQSHITTVSTIGIADRIVPFGSAFPHVRLAVSLHAPTDEQRTTLVPLNVRHDLRSIVDACRTYNALHGKKVFFEYVLIRDVNDRLEDAFALGELVRDVHSTINLIPLNPGGRLAGIPPERERIDAFRATLKRVFPGHVTYRRSRGVDIDAACGQLARKAQEPQIPA